MNTADVKAETVLRPYLGVGIVGGSIAADSSYISVSNGLSDTTTKVNNGGMVGGFANVGLEVIAKTNFISWFICCI